MKKLLFLTAIIFLLLPSILTADEIELGIALTPMGVLMDESDRNMEVAAGSGGILKEFILGLHAGYCMSGLLYASLDANAMPAWFIEKITRTGAMEQGIRATGFISFIDVGIRPKLGNLILLAELGINYLYLHSEMVAQQEQDASNSRLGVNFRAGVGYSFYPFSVSLIVTSIFPDFSTMAAVFKGLFNEEQWAKESLNLMPSIAAYLHL